ncbi:hypothetical protein FRAHR75_470032 [Frankia sp. Hr75.2]|nr:hypothetical protein FRAHR75_470032 [Frankia sp. Hr75.2]
MRATLFFPTGPDPTKCRTRLSRRGPPDPPPTATIGEIGPVRRQAEIARTGRPMNRTVAVRSST